MDTGAQRSMIKRESFQGLPPTGGKQVLVTGVNGSTITYPLVKIKLDIPLQPHHQPRKYEVILGNANILGMDVLRGKKGRINGERWAFGVSSVPHATHLEEESPPHYSVNLLSSAPALPPSTVTNIKQYNVPAEAISPVTDLIKDLEQRGILIRTHSRFNSPVWPIKKPNGKWRLTIDYRKLNSNTGPLTAAVPSITVIVNTIQTWDKPWLAVLDVKDMFFMVPLQPADQERFAFTWKGVQYTFTRMPQGFKHSPTICHGALAKVLDDLILPPNVQTVQYIDDILIGGKTSEEVQETMNQIKGALEALNLELPAEKCQGPSQEIKFLGTVWMGGRRSVPNDTVQELNQAPSPESKDQLRQILGTLGFWRKHVPGFAIIARPLYNLLKKSTAWEWAPAHEEALRQLIGEIHTYQALGPIHPEAPFHLYLTVGATGMSYALWQESDTAPRRPIQFGSKSWQGSQANYAPYEKVLLAAYTALRETEELTQDKDITIHTPLPIIKPILEGKELPPGVAQKMTIQRWALYIHHRVGSADTAQNPTMIQESLWKVGMPDEYRLPPQQSPIKDAAPFDPSKPEGVWFTDGSARLVKGKWKGKAAAVPADTSAAPLTAGIDGSAQLAELAAIKLACEAGATAVYTDSYAVWAGATQWITNWKNNHWEIGGKPVWGLEYWKWLYQHALQQPLSIGHVSAHQRNNTPASQLNNLADAAAQLFTTQVEWERLYSWLHDNLGHTGSDELVRQAHIRGRPITHRQARDLVQACTICAETRKHIAEGQRFARLRDGKTLWATWQVDYVGPLPTTRQRWKYILTGVEIVSGIGFAYPTRLATGLSTVMGLNRLTAIVPMPQEIQSDNGSHFKNKLVREWTLKHGVQWTFHLPYRPQSNGMVERWNGLLKNHLKPTDGTWGDRLDEVVQRLNNRQTPTGSPISRGFFPTGKAISPARTPLHSSKYAPGDTVVIKHPALGTFTCVLHAYKEKGVWSALNADKRLITITEAWIASKTG
ncbi:unnamed protein product [Eretmochelys imbricata]